MSTPLPDIVQSVDIEAPREAVWRVLTAPARRLDVPLASERV